MSVLLLPLLLFQAPSSAPATAAAEPQPEGPHTRARPTFAAGELANLHFGDYDGDGLDDVYVIRPGAGDRLLWNRGDGTFHDATLEAGLAELPSAFGVLWHDLDGDGRLDLLRLGVARGVLLLQRTQGRFSDGSVDSGLSQGPELLAQVIDLDRDGLPDLHLVSASSERVLRNLGDARFEAFDLEVSSRLAARLRTDAGPEAPRVPLDAPTEAAREGDSGPGSALRTEVSAAASGASAGALGGSVATPPSAPPPSSMDMLASSCTRAISDHAAPMSCIEASSIPTLGRLYPQTLELNVSSATGYVGLNTTGPTARLHVEGGAIGTALYAVTSLNTGRAIHARNTAGGSLNYAVFAEVAGSNGRALYGYASANSGTTRGVMGEVESTSGRGVFGYAKATSGATQGVYGRSDSSSGAGVEGSATAISGNTFGVRGVASSVSGVGVEGVNDSTDALAVTVGVRGTASTVNGVGVRGQAPAAGAGVGIGVEGTSGQQSGRGVLGTASSTSGAAIGVEGVSNASGGSGVIGRSLATSGITYGVAGQTNSNSGYGVRGVATNSVGGFGVSGQSLGSFGVGVAAQATGVNGTAIVADALASGGVGALIAGREFGIDARASDAEGTAIFGEATATSGATVGVHGRVSSPDGIAVRGEYAGTSFGVGVSAISAAAGGHALVADATGSGATAIRALADAGTAVDATGSGLGVWARAAADAGVGVRAEALQTGGIGVLADGAQDYGTGVWASGDEGVRASGEKWGVIATGDEYGVFATSSATSSYAMRADATGTSLGSLLVVSETDPGYHVGIAVTSDHAAAWADGVRSVTTAPGGYAGHFYATNSSPTSRGIIGIATAPAVAISAGGNFTASGSKMFVQPHPTDGTKEIRFVCLEGNESGTYFRGSARTEGGVAVIEVPEEFRLVSIEEHITVQLTPRGPWRTWCESSTLDAIVVRSERDVDFDYLVQGRRRGFADHQAVQQNSSFLPRYRGEPYGDFLPPELRQMLVTSGILNGDFTPNEAYLRALGVELAESPSDQARRLAERDAEAAAKRAELERAHEGQRSERDRSSDSSAR